MAPSSDLLSNIKDAVTSDENPDYTALNAEQSYVDKELDRDLKREDIKTRKEHNNLLEQNRVERKKYARHIFIFTCIWATLIFLIVIASGLKKYSGFELSDKVLITLITSTTVNFFGFFLLVVKYLFHIGDKEKEEKHPAKPKKPKKQKEDSAE